MASFQISGESSKVFPFLNKLYGEFAFIDVNEDCEEHRDDGDNSPGISNSFEVIVVRQIIKKIILGCQSMENCSCCEIGVISQYNAQLEKLRRVISQIHIKNQEKITIEIDVADNFSEKMKDIIIFSAVRSNPLGSINTMDHFKKLEVTLSRRRYGAYIVGNRNTLKKNESWNDFINNASYNGCLFQAHDDAAISRLFHNHRIDVGQIAEILRPGTYLFEDTLWTAIFSREFKESLKRIESIELRTRALYAIKKLMSGLWPRDTLSAKFTSQVHPKIIHVQNVGSSRFLIWTVDVDRSSKLIQILKIWDLVEENGVNCWIKRLEKALKTYEKFYLQRCEIETSNIPTSKIVLPRDYSCDPPCNCHFEVKIENEEKEDTSKDDNILLMKFYNISSGIARELLAGNNMNYELPFVLSEKETEIVNYPKSEFILGRSDFERFETQYWPRLDYYIKKKMDSLMVYREIMSFIKGSLESLRSEDGRISHESYVNIASKRYSCYDVSQRDLIYGVYRQYERMKKQRGDHDMGDYVHYVYRRLLFEGYSGPKLHFVYVDEVQDLTQAQIALLKFVCQNVEDGFVFAGDTAQTIAKGVDFRFADIRSLFYQEFLGNPSEELDSLGNSSSNVRDNVQNRNKELRIALPQERRGRGIPKVPDMHFLNQNFRSHNGIMRLADTVVQLIAFFFPSSIDKLDSEYSVIKGEVPSFFLHENSCDSIVKCFESSESSKSSSSYDFGSEQVILVTSRETKEKLHDNVQERALVLTAQECKGLEFKDVFIYNFFTDSQLHTKWRIIYEFMESNGIYPTGELVHSKDGHWIYPEFDPNMHNLLCSELKILYVLLSRARRRLWFIEEDSEACRPMLTLWKRKRLIKMKSELDYTHSKEESSSENWRSRGFSFFNMKNYESAKFCFEKSRDKYLSELSSAFALQQSGNRLLGVHPSKAYNYFETAANMFLKLDKFKEAGKCLQQAREYKKAGEVYRNKFQPPSYGIAGKCYEEAKCFEEALECYSQAWMINEALSCCLYNKLFEEGTAFIENTELKLMNESCSPMYNYHDLSALLVTSKEKYFQSVASHYYRIKRLDLMMTYINRFPFISKQRIFLERYELFDSLIEWGIEHGELLLAAKTSRKIGNLGRALELYLKATRISEALHCALIQARQKLFQHSCVFADPLISEAVSDLEKVIEIGELSSEKFDDVEEAKILLALMKVNGNDVNGAIDWETLFEKCKTLNRPHTEMVAVGTALSRSLKYLHHSCHNFSCYETAYYYWLRWYEMISNFIHVSYRLSVSKTKFEDQNFIQACQSIFVTEFSDNNSFKCIVENVSANWLSGARIKPLRKHGNRGELSIEDFGYYAFDYLFHQLHNFSILTAEKMKNKYRRSGTFLLRRCKLILMTIQIFTALLRECKNEALKKTLREGQFLTENELMKISMPKLLMKDDIEMKMTFSLRLTPDVKFLMENACFDFLKSDLKKSFSNFNRIARFQTYLPYLDDDNLSLIERKIGCRFSEYDEDCPYHAMMIASYYELNSRNLICNGTTINALEFICYEAYALQEIYISRNVAKQFIDPFAFLRLLEKTIVIICALITKFNPLFLPTSLVLDYLAVPNMYQMFNQIIQRDCSDKQICQARESLHFLTWIILSILESREDSEYWFGCEKLHYSYKASFFVRLLILLIISILNSGHKEIASDLLSEIKIRCMSSRLNQFIPNSFKFYIPFLFENRDLESMESCKLRSCFMGYLTHMNNNLLLLKLKQTQTTFTFPGNNIVFINTSDSVVFNLDSLVSTYHKKEKYFSIPKIKKINNDNNSIDKESYSNRNLGEWEMSKGKVSKEEKREKKEREWEEEEKEGKGEGEKEEEIETEEIETEKKEDEDESEEEDEKEEFETEEIETEKKEDEDEREEEDEDEREEEDEKEEIEAEEEIETEKKEYEDENRNYLKLELLASRKEEKLMLMRKKSEIKELCIVGNRVKFKDKQIPTFVANKLRQLLSRVREKLSRASTPLEANISFAKSISQSYDCDNQEYISFFGSSVCPFQLDVQNTLELARTEIDILKSNMDNDTSGENACYEDDEDTLFTI